ncbi:TauD/TfdA family dioxygenase [Streptomyces sp. VRA16 Mangrove soil]|uniref:TauD/TfdA family dioxygenase n=1 Tax=Streptomyces sp. VRA16 Mangrove soil TaxID=2817434 RepID=UPI001A9D7BC9|nr:TauD/TfdA family dioxygenase [Streptomyces sp. VRA16 Mangrove soil]MBO1335462.1 TauD/TfdA family dioxygenase [Streptomyces sp. VRA16 Mangrove soil]
MPLSSPSPDIQLSPDSPPLLAADGAGDPEGWTARHRDTLRAAVAAHGALLVRGLALADPGAAAAVFRCCADALMPDREPFAPRRTYGNGVYSATKWPPNQQMCMHHEVSYALEFPGLMLFACLEAPASGGATGLADAGAVLDALPAGLTKRFEQEGWLLTRAYHEEIGASVAEAFGTDDRAAVTAYCRAHAIDCAWRGDGSLHTRQHRSAVVGHPVDGRRVWFNQIAFLSEWTMEPEVRAYLTEEYGPDGLPFNTRYGNGDPIDEDVVRLLNEVYEQHTVRTRWAAGDLLLVDNVRTAHSRDPFDGPREVLAALAEPVRLADCAPTIEVGAV